MDNKEEIKKELREISPALEKMEKQNPFRVPDYYFQSLPDKMLEKVRGTATPVLWMDKLETALNNFFSTIFSPRYAIPGAVLLIVLVVGINFLKNVNDVPLDDARLLAEIPSEEISAYAIENFDDADLIAFIGSPDNGDDILLMDIPKDELEDFFKNDSDNQIPEEDFL